MVCSFIRRERDLAGQPHQSDFMIALDHAASSSNRSGGGDFHLTSSFGNTFGEDKAHCFFHSDGSSGDAAILKALRNPLIRTDRKSTRLNSSHVSISYAVFCLKKKN